MEYRHRQRGRVSRRLGGENGGFGNRFWKLLWEQVDPENSFGSQDISQRYAVRPVSTPTIVGERVIACGFGGSVRCLDLKPGNQYWAVDLVKEYGANQFNRVLHAVLGAMEEAPPIVATALRARPLHSDCTSLEKVT